MRTSSITWLRSSSSSRSVELKAFSVSVGARMVIVPRVGSTNSCCASKTFFARLPTSVISVDVSPGR